MRQLISVLSVASAFLGAVVQQPSRARADAATAAFDAGMQPVLASYLAIQDQLSKDSIDGIGTAGGALAQAALRLDPSTVTGEHASHYKDIPRNLQRSAEAVARARDIGAARDAFKQLSQPMAMWASMSHPEGVDVLFCSMAKASWLQKHGEMRNPYYGASDLHCGEALASTLNASAVDHNAQADAHRGH